ncbi:hypothetical protein HGRIS_002092 [Hohenbuehelia grisea]|uniref:Proteophosphoglycan ppg4 n=1 Tax=Hohenbuehelia grisea TaxID=104357 RepID=A0ABR3JJE8_9AGAR
MAAACYPGRPDTSHSLGGPSGSGYSQAVVTDLDFQDNRYPALASPSIRASSMLVGSSDISPQWDPQGPQTDATEANQRQSQAFQSSPRQEQFSPQEMENGRPPTSDSASGTARGPGQSSSRQPATQSPSQSPTLSQSLYPSQMLFRATSSGSGTTPTTDIQSLRSLQSQSPQSPGFAVPSSHTGRQEASVSYSLPPGTARRVVERYSLDDQTNGDRAPSRESEGLGSHMPQQGPGSHMPTQRNSVASASLGVPDRPSSLLPSSPRHPSLPLAGVGVNGNVSNPNSPFPQHMLPLSASPTYSPPISPNMRAYAQQPTYINPGAPAPATNPTYSPALSSQARFQQPQSQPQPVQYQQPQRVQPVQEEVCVECAMRDQDMADVDVLTPGVWERESDAQYQDLLQRELEEEATGIRYSANGSGEGHSQKPRARGGRLTEQNIRIWLTMNPREPAARQQTLSAYIKSQRSLLEAEALAHARAMQEAQTLDNRMRDAYSQLRRSAYDTGSTALPDETGGVRIKPPVPISPSSPYTPSAYVPQPPSHAYDTHGRGHSREITLLENGMIVEHVDVRKEEREARERRRKEEKRARKSSRSSGVDVTSMYSTQSFPASPLLPGDSMGLSQSGQPYSRYSQATMSTTGRPTSVLTAPLDGMAGRSRPDLPRAYSQASFSDAHSLGPGSPKRRFLGFKNLTGWRSQDSLAPSGMSVMSGSVVNMHVALAREGSRPYSASPIDLNTPTRRSQIWPPVAEYPEQKEEHPVEKPKKKKNGLAKIWRLVTGSGKHDTPHADSIKSSGDRTEDDAPLAPPPPLSYLVDRTPGEALSGSMSSPSTRHMSTPSLAPVSPKMPGVPLSPGMSSSTPPSSMLPSPVSSRPSAHLEIVDPSADSWKSNGGIEDPSLQLSRDQRLDESMLPDGALKPGVSRNVQPMNSEPDMRRRSSQSPATVRPPLPTPPQSRPLSVMSRDKSLPPLPGNNTFPADARPRSGTTGNADRPRTVYAYDVRALPPGSGPAHDFLPPQAGFRAPDARRQSFGGMSSRPNFAAQTMPAQYKAGADARQSFSPQYDDFGLSRYSLRNEQTQNVPTTVSATPKRKSRFGLSSLLGKKHSQPEKESLGLGYDTQQLQFPAMRQSVSDMQEDMSASAYAASTSRHSAISGVGPNTARMSVASRKALDDLVSQDPDFIAYRYPSNEQRFDLLR